MGRLDIAIGFEPPEPPGAFCAELSRLLNCQECVYFLTGKSGMLRTSYGVIRAGA